MKALLIAGLVSILLISLGLILLCIIGFYDKLSKEYVQKWAEIAISWLTFTALVCAGIFGFIKYDDYKKESNYQKVMVRYLDNNVDRIIPLLSDYSTNVCISLNTLVSQVRANCLPSISDREKLHSILTYKYGKAYNNLHALLVFDPAVYKCFMSVLYDSEVYLNEYLLAPTVSIDKTEDIRIKKALIQNQARFAIFNLQNIGEEIRKNVDSYEKPNLEHLENDKEYRRIISLFNDYISKRDAMLEAKEPHDRFEKSISFFDYLSKYLETNGIPSEKLIVMKK
jgi:hypothetical protein